MTFVIEERNVFAVTDDSRRRVIGYNIDGRFLRAMVFPDRGDALVFAGKKCKLEFSEPAIKMPQLGRKYSPLISCPSPYTDGRVYIEEAKLWEVARHFADPDVLSYARWERLPGWTRGDIKAIVLLFAEGGLCQKPRERRRTLWNTSVEQTDVFAYIAGATPPPPQKEEE